MSRIDPTLMLGPLAQRPGGLLSLYNLRSKFLDMTLAWGLYVASWLSFVGLRYPEHHECQVRVSIWLLQRALVPFCLKLRVSCDVGGRVGHITRHLCDPVSLQPGPYPGPHAPVPGSEPTTSSYMAGCFFCFIPF